MCKYCGVNTVPKQRIPSLACTYMFPVETFHNVRLHLLDVQFGLIALIIWRKWDKWTLMSTWRSPYCRFNRKINLGTKRFFGGKYLSLDCLIIKKALLVSHQFYYYSEKHLFQILIIGWQSFLDFENLILKVSLRFFVLLFGCFIILIYWYFRREPLGRWWLSNVSLGEIVASNHRLVAAYYPLSDNNQPCTHMI